MRRFCVMAVFGLGLMVLTAAESQAGGCLFGWLFHHGGSQACCYAPPVCPSPCAPSPCGQTTCGYAPAPCSSCSPCGISAGGSGCATGNCGVTYEHAPTEAVYYSRPTLFPMFAAPMFSRPVVVTSPRYTEQTTSLTLEPRVVSESRTKRADDKRRPATTSRQWEPVGLLR